jgi:perosamine synthetase
MGEVMKIPWSTPSIGVDEVAAVNRTLSSGWLGMGPKTKEFEEVIRDRTHAREVIALNNGTSALLAVYMALGIGPGDEILVPTYTFVAPASAAMVLGARPVLMDCDARTLNVTPEAIQEHLSGRKKVRAVVVVDVGGQSVDLDPITELCQDHKVPLVEDAAEAFGGAYKSRPTGKGGHATVLSFHIAKQATSVEGGAVSTDDTGLADRVRLIRSHGERKQKYVHEELGLNLRPTDLLSAIGVEQVRRLDQFLTTRHAIAKVYIQGLSDWLEFQEVPSFVSQPTWMVFFAMARNRKTRDDLVDSLSRQGVDTRIAFPPIHQQPCFLRRFPGKGERYPVADSVFERVLSLPMGNGMTLEQAHEVVSATRAFFNQTER